jgi:hypothetical protein
MIRTHYLSGTTDIPSTVPKDHLVVNVLKWSQCKWKSLCPYLLQTDGKECIRNGGGIIFENFWQGTKVFKNIYPQEQYASRFHQGKPEHLWFSHNMKCTLIHQDQLDKAKYLEWRDLVWSCPKPVRYPNGINHRHEVLYCLDDYDNHIGYLDARKEIYVKEYCRLVQDTPEFKELLRLHKAGKNLLICEMDVPSANKYGAYAKYAEDGPLSVPLTPASIDELLNDTTAPFGHGLCLVKLLLDLGGLGALGK